MQQFSFIHTADIHLDSPLRGLSAYDGPAADRIRTATRQAFDNLIGEAVAREVDFVIIAGDLYDGDWRDYQTGLFFIRQMGRLTNAGIPAYLLHGNHDADSQITKRLTLPQQVHTFPSRKPETFRIPELGVALHGRSFPHREVTENFARTYPDPVEGHFNIGILHTGLGGLGGHENYAPCLLEELTAKGYGYWALGHVHQAALLSKRPHVVFPGNLQGRHIRETGAKSACLVTVTDLEITDFTPLHTDVVRWAMLIVDLDECEREGDVPGRMREAIALAIDTEADGRLLACRIRLTGQTGTHHRLLTSRENLLAEARAAALSLGDEAAWIEDVVVATQPAHDPAASAAREEVLGDLQRMTDDAPGDPALLAALEADIGELIRKLPPDLRADSEDAILAAALSADYAGVISQGRSYLDACLADAKE